MSGRRNFLKTLGGLASAPALPFASLYAATLDEQVAEYATVAAPQLAQDEDFWFLIKQAYTASPNMVNVNNGGVSPQPKGVQEAQDHYQRLSNEAPGYYMWRILGPMREAVRGKLAQLGGCSQEEIALQQNATQALETAIFGIDLQPGDEILTTDQDYPSMLSALRQRERRESIVIKKISLPVPMNDPDEVVRRFEAAIGPRTRVILVCQIVNLTGQGLPVKEICALARQRGIRTIVDGAHGFAQLEFNIPDLGCDYYGTSLHKWLCAPFGTGMLYVRREEIDSLWPLYGAVDGEEKDIRKFEHLGTRSFPAEVATGHAIDFHNGIGTARKRARLLYLRDYWIDAVRDLPGFSLNTALDPEFSCGIVNFALEGVDAQKLGNQLLSDYQIYTTVTQHDDVKGVRISPHVYTSLLDLDRLVEALRAIRRQ